MNFTVCVNERGCDNDFVERVTPPSLPRIMFALLILKRNGVTIHVNSSAVSSFSHVDNEVA